MAATSPDALADVLRTRLEARPEVLEAYLFGSQAQGNAHSDVDVAVFIDLSRAPDSPFGYAADLTTVLGAALHRRDVDVVVLNTAPPLLYHRVLSGGIRLMSRDLQATTTREGRAISRYCDYVPQLRLIGEALKRRIEAGEFGR